MPNFFSAFTNDVFRPLATLLIPGVIGISSWFIALLWHFPKLHALVTQNHTESGFILFLVTVFAGIVLEDIGARWEVHSTVGLTKGRTTNIVRIGLGIYRRLSSPIPLAGAMRGLSS